MARQNPTRHIPKTNYGRKPVKRSYLITKYDANDNEIGQKRGKATIDEIMALGASMVKGKVARVVVDY